MKKENIEGASNAIDNLYSKYKDKVYEAPENMEEIETEVERMNSPYLSIDRFLGGGPAYGKITTYAGFASTSKTSLALSLAGANPDKTIGFIDAEYNWTDASYLWVDKYFGIEKERIHIMHPTYLEEAAAMIEDMSEALDIIIYDGFDMVAPKMELEAGNESQQMGIMAKLYKKFFRRSMGKIYKSKAALIITNHLYAQIGNIYEPFKEPGGSAINDYASQKLWLRSSKLRDTSKNIIGRKVSFEIKKDKLTGNQDLKFDMDYYRDYGFDVFTDILRNAEDLGVIDKKGSWYSYDNTKLGQGEVKTADVLRDNPELVDEVVNKCKELF